MKKLLAILVLILCFITPSQADDIRDFEIEGMSIGDSLLEFMSISEIEKSAETTKNVYKSNKFSMITLIMPNGNYGAVQFHIKKNDKNYKIYSVSGQRLMPIEACIKERDKAFKELKELFPYTKMKDFGKRKHPGYKDSYSHSIYFQFQSGDLIEIACYDYNDQIDKSAGDKLTISMDTREFNDFLSNDAF